MRFLSAILVLFGFLLGSLLSVLFVLFMNSPSTTLVYSFFNTPSGVELTSIDNDTATIIVVMGGPFIGAILGILFAIVMVKALGFELVRNQG